MKDVTLALGRLILCILLGLVVVADGHIHPPVLYMFAVFLSTVATKRRSV